jgi:phage-related tail protein
MTLGDDAFDLIPVPDGRMALRIAGQVAVAGAIVGGLEALGIALSSRFEGSLLDRAAMGAAVVAADATVGASVGLAGGLGSCLRVSMPLALWHRHESP